MVRHESTSFQFCMKRPCLYEERLTKHPWRRYIALPSTFC
ncbi:hypothetical protein GJA_3022 [Janthinobacterium agaricidamnosum NBRC 102515 = DSM 9628]|uniref:Uncharacterized protein n=1 Tax=Janthinobacterium agaricidamnosum NBRC 102515 = DSM 9628 TaxID=1349767 RepID=W0V8H5_9BURK|nr:hypothetical protein GJA_3022 [Janthinobacterium agaricidamnosum NBRC 102515 = DSM 9628]